jgi:tetratricopeptide (TPR) repeat protein
MKRRLAAAVLVLAAGAGVTVAYMAAARDREYQRLVAAGEAALAARQPGTAIEAFSGAIALKPDAMLAHLKRGETYRLQGDLKAALRDLRAAAELDPSATRPLEPLGDVTLALQRPELAAERYAAYIQLDDRSPRVLYKLAVAHYRAGQCAEAVASLRRALELDPRQAHAHYLLGLCMTAPSDARKARAAFEKAISLDPGHIPALEALAALNRTAGRHAEAAEHLEALAALDRSRPQRLIALALEYADARRTDLAVTTLSRAAERFPDSVQVYAALGEIWLRIWEDTSDRVALGKALEALRTAVVRGGSGPELALYGRAQLAAGDTKGAVRSLSEAASRLPVSDTTLLTLASAAEQIGQRRTARDALERHVALDVSHVPSAALCRRLGDLSSAIGDKSRATYWWRRATAVQPDAQLLLNLAGAEMAIGEVDRARVSLDRAATLLPDDPRVARLRRQLDSR